MISAIWISDIRCPFVCLLVLSYTRGLTVLPVDTPSQKIYLAIVVVNHSLIGWVIL
jgi:hypothetical protein